MTLPTQSFTFIKSTLQDLNQTMTSLQIENGAILAFDQEKQLAEGEKTIHVIPVWKWLQLS